MANPSESQKRHPDGGIECFGGPRDGERADVWDAMSTYPIIYGATEAGCYLASRHPKPRGLHYRWRSYP